MLTTVLIQGLNIYRHHYMYEMHFIDQVGLKLTAICCLLSAIIKGVSNSFKVYF